MGGGGEKRLLRWIQALFLYPDPFLRLHRTRPYRQWHQPFSCHTSVIGYRRREGKGRGPGWGLEASLQFGKMIKMCPGDKWQAESQPTVLAAAAVASGNNLHYTGRWGTWTQFDLPSVIDLLLPYLYTPSYSKGGGGLMYATKPKQSNSRSLLANCQF